MALNFLAVSKFFLYLVPFSVLIVSKSTFFPFIVGKYVFFRTAAALALLFFVWAWARGEVKTPDFRSFIFNPLAAAVSAFALIYVSAGFFGYDPAASFWSNFERGEGGFQMLSLLTFFILLILVFKDEASWRRLFLASVGAAALAAVYGLLAASGAGGFIGGNLCGRLAGSLGNAAYLGTLMIFAVFYAAYLATGENSSFRRRYLWPAAAFFFFVVLLLTQTRGALLGLVVGLLAFLVYLIFTFPSGRPRKMFLAGALALVVLVSLAVAFRQSINLMPFCESGGNRILDVTVNAQNFQTRLLLWEKSIAAFKERPLLGWGPENFLPAFEKQYDPYFTVWYDRAHNIFFDYLVMTGALGLLSFIGIFAVYYRQFARRRIFSPATEKLKFRESAADYLTPVRSALLFSLPISYLVQGLVLFDVLPIYINLFLFLAFAAYKFNFKS